MYYVENVKRVGTLYCGACGAKHENMVYDLTHERNNTFNCAECGIGNSICVSYTAIPTEDIVNAS